MLWKKPVKGMAGGMKKATNRMTCRTVISYKYLKLISAGGLSGGLNDVGSISDSEFGMLRVSRGDYESTSQ
jgi:hypothetical protein